jgi:uncharacterized phage-associated protein
MLSARDVARYFLSKVDEDSGDGISNLKLQKLVYYAQGYHLALYGRPLFAERIEAWEHGPVVPELYRVYREHGSAPIPVPDGFELPRQAFASPEEHDRTKALLDEVYDVFGQYSAWKLRNMTHEEQPWKAAYRENANREISHEAMHEYYRDYVVA